MKVLLASFVLFALFLSGCSSSEEKEASTKPSDEQSQAAASSSPDKPETAANSGNTIIQNNEDLKVVFEEDDYPVVFDTDAGNIFKNPQGNSEPPIKLLSHDPNLKIADEIKTRGRSLGLRAEQSADGKRIWAMTRYGGRIWDLANGKELVNFYLKFPETPKTQGNRSPQALRLEARDENTLVNRGYIPEMRLSPDASLLVTRKNLHSDSNSKGRITVYDTISRKPLWTHEAETPGEEFTIIGFTDDGQQLIVKKQKQDTFVILDSRSGKSVTEMKPQADFKISATSVRQTPTGLVFSSTDHDDHYSIEIWSPTDWKLKGKIAGRKKKPEKRNNFSSTQPAPTAAEILLPGGWSWIDKALLATTDDNLTIKVWDLNQADFDPASPHWSGKQLRDWPAFQKYYIEVPPDTRSSGLPRLGLKAPVKTSENTATQLTGAGELYHADNHQYLGSLNFEPVNKEGQERIIISDNSGQHITLDESLILETPQGLRCLLLQAGTPALDQYRIIDRTPRITGATPLKFAAPNFVIEDVVFNNNDKGQLNDNHRKFEFVTALRGDTRFAISSTGNIVTPLMADGSSGLSAAVISVPAGNSFLFKPGESTLLGYCSDAAKLAFATSNGVSLHNAEDGALLQKVTYTTNGYEPFLSHLLSPDGSRVISVRKTKQGLVWSITNCLTGKHEGDLPVATQLKSKNGSAIEIHPLAISADNNKVLFFADQLYVWDIPQQKEQPFNSAAMESMQEPVNKLMLKNMMKPIEPEEMQQRVSFTADSQQIAILNGDLIEFWNLESGQLDRQLSLPLPASQYRLLPDGKNVLYSNGNQIFLSDLNAPVPEVVLTGTRFPLEHFEISTNGQFVASVCVMQSAFVQEKAKPLLRIWDLNSLKSGGSGQETIVVQVSEPQITKSMATVTPGKRPTLPGFTPQPTKPSEPAKLSADQKKQIEAFKAILKPDQSFAGKWTVAKLSGRIALKVVKGPTEDVYEVVLYDPSRVSETKSFEAAFVPDKEKLFLELTPIKGSGLDKTPSRIPKTYNLLLIPDMRTYRFILDKTTLIGMDTLGINYQLFQQ